MGSDSHRPKSDNTEIAESTEDTEKNRVGFPKRMVAHTLVAPSPLCDLCALRVERFLVPGDLRQLCLEHVYCGPFGKQANNTSFDT